MIGEPSRMSLQPGKEREGGMEMEKLSSHLAQNRLHNKSRTEHDTVWQDGGLDSPNHVVSSLLLTPKSRRVIREGHLYLHAHRSMRTVSFLLVCYHEQITSFSILPQFTAAQWQTQNMAQLTFILMF